MLGTSSSTARWELMVSVFDFVIAHIIGHYVGEANCSKLGEDRRNESHEDECVMDMPSGGLSRENHTHWKFTNNKMSECLPRAFHSSFMHIAVLPDSLLISISLLAMATYSHRPALDS